ncbi:hypothetical protein [Corynebacterium uterequi]|uniref:Uncharacterized protein n=1 Tax=Corynebacterium uterequi TaxID=1072256 RepID=A0A0G3HDT6_9CORY|nr:hypothetical protein [Corynebacterium uterequi]AKK11531.1 hypothetical protein CUTER_07710 [Corynebacterium uterequi]
MIDDAELARTVEAEIARSLNWVDDLVGQEVAAVEDPMQRFLPVIFAAVAALFALSTAISVAAVLFI